MRENICQVPENSSWCTALVHNDWGAACPAPLLSVVIVNRRTLDGGGRPDVDTVDRDTDMSMRGKSLVLGNRCMLFALRVSALCFINIDFSQFSHVFDIKIIEALNCKYFWTLKTTINIKLQVTI